MLPFSKHAIACPTSPRTEVLGSKPQLTYSRVVLLKLMGAAATEAGCRIGLYQILSLKLVWEISLNLNWISFIVCKMVTFNRRAKHSPSMLIPSLKCLLSYNY